MTGLKKSTKLWKAWAQGWLAWRSAKLARLQALGTTCGCALWKSTRTGRTLQFRTWSALPSSGLSRSRLSLRLGLLGRPSSKSFGARSLARAWLGNLLAKSWSSLWQARLLIWSLRKVGQATMRRTWRSSWSSHGEFLKPWQPWKTIQIILKLQGRGFLLNLNFSRPSMLHLRSSYILNFKIWKAWGKQI